MNKINHNCYFYKNTQIRMQIFVASLLASQFLIFHKSQRSLDQVSSAQTFLLKMTATMSID